MDCNENWEAIGDSVDGTRDAAGVVALEAHLTTCVRCQSVMADLRAIRGAARSLEPQVPPVHAWPRLAAAIEAEPTPHLWRPLFSGGPPVWQPLAAAAMLLLVLSGLFWVGNGLRPLTAPENQIARAGTAPVELDGSVDAEFRLAEEQYVAAIASLEEITGAERSRLDDHTVDVLRTSVEAIDEAIGESRAALESEPTNELAQDSLFDALRSKVDLLQDTVALISELRQGDQEGAERTGSDVNE